jgi:peroxiredoxin Q/BCP
MAQLRQDHDKFVAEDTVVLVLGPEDTSAFKNYWQKNDLPFIGLPDPTHSVLKLYGQQIKIFKFGRMPAQVTIDKQGIVRFVHYGHDAADIPANEEILAVVKEFNQEKLHG